MSTDNAESLSESTKITDTLTMENVKSCDFDLTELNIDLCSDSSSSESNSTNSVKCDVGIDLICDRMQSAFIEWNESKQLVFLRERKRFSTITFLTFLLTFISFHFVLVKKAFKCK